MVIQTYWDIRYKEIPILVSLVGGILGVVICIWEQRGFVDVMCALIPGIAALLIGRISKEAIGYGDGVLLCVMGFYFTLEELLAVCMIAFMAAALIALILLVVFHKKGSYEIPFVPFLLIAYGVENLVKAGGF